MAIVTASAGGENAGCLVGYHSRVALDPPRYLVCLSTANLTYRVARRTSTLAVHLLDRVDLRLASLFGEVTGDDVDKFDRCRWHPGPGGAPLLDEVGHRIVGSILQRVPFGDHEGFLLEPALVEPGRTPLWPLTSADVASFTAGHEA
jgi:flavin reductase (DIM6/NTAB) family NADH-FMN oxidoreductase RutF